jgi:hypothetical protein
MQFFIVITIISVSIYAFQLMKAFIDLNLGDVKTKKDFLAAIHPLYYFLSAYRKYKELD